MYNFARLFIIILFIAGCSSQKKLAQQSIQGLKLLGEFDLPYKMQYKSTTVGGLSGIDYDTKNDCYYLICDDRSDINPARFYTAKIAVSNSGIDSVVLINVATLKQSTGDAYPNKSQDAYHVPDPEAIRLNRANNHLLWSSEGERIVQEGKTVLLNPSVNIMTRDGRLVDSFLLPKNMIMTSKESGPRRNGAFEGLAFADDSKTLYVSVEEPIYEDGPRAGLGDSTGWVRIIKYDVATKQPVAQFAYQIDPVVQEPASAGTFIINGISDILSVNSHQLLVTERSFSTGRSGCNVRLYLAELNGADNVQQVPSLVHSSSRPIQKKLLLNMDHLGRYVDNVEGATFGPKLPNGKRSLVLVVDDNFSETEKTQFFLFEVE